MTIESKHTAEKMDNTRVDFLKKLTQVARSLETWIFLNRANTKQLYQK